VCRTLSLNFDDGPDELWTAHDAFGPGSLRDGCTNTVAPIEPLIAAARDTGMWAGPLP
jgi:hypothetical protein